MMNVSGDYDKILEDTLKDDLEWLEQEFELLFKHKREKASKEDLTIGAHILDKVIGNIKLSSNEDLLNLLSITLNRLEKIYPAFF